MGAGTSQLFEMKNVDDIRNKCENVALVSPVVRTRVQAIAGANNWSTTIYGGNPSLLQIREWSLASGNMYTDDDDRRGQKVCLLGKTVVTNLFGEGADPIGQDIRLNNIPFKIIGVLASKGADMFGNDQDDVVITPFTTAQRRIVGTTYVQQIFASAISKDAISTATNEISEVLRNANNLKSATGDDPFTIRTQEEISSILNSTSTIMIVLLGSIAGISLLVGGIGIMNIMYVSVTERTKEIGLRMAIGARNRDILRQFLTEAIFISLVGGVIGIMIGVGFALIFGHFMGWPISVSSFSIALSSIFSIAIGVFFGWYPARKAAQLVPMEALRYE